MDYWSLIKKKDNETGQKIQKNDETRNISRQNWSPEGAERKNAPPKIRAKKSSSLGILSPRRCAGNSGTNHPSKWLVTRI
jgi:hypothetical protein